jgi:protein-disulfide isomerase
MYDPATSSSPAPRPSPSGMGRRRAGRPSGVRPARLIAPLTGLLAGALILAVPAVAADPSPADAPDSPQVAATAPAPAPTLTMAPLITLPPIAPPPFGTPVELADGHALGEEDAPVTVEIWEDFQCPACQAFSFQVKPQIVGTYVQTGQVRLVFRDLAFLGEESRWASVAASLAADQNLFWPFHDYLFANLQGGNVGSYSLDRMLEIAEIVGMDLDAFVAGLQVDAARERFAELQAAARSDAQALGINATPTVVVNGTVVPSADWDTVRSAIDDALGQGG